ncbi:MAG: hypothetical protein U0704_00430 [Candidatus Eisenbacteria bacterium]
MRARGGRGFVLVGVVMFVLALTILGLSIYALSGYEAQFLTDTQAEEQAVFRAEGGIALAQALLAVPPYAMSQTHFSDGRDESIVRATAWQYRAGGAKDSTGVLSWSDSVFFRVVTQVGGQRKVIEQGFRPQQRFNPYRRLFTSRLIEYLATDGAGRNRRNSTELQGLNQAVWQYVRNAGDTSWVRDVDWNSGRPMLTIQTPTPDVAGYMTARYGTGVLAAFDTTNVINRLTFDAGSDAGTGYFYRPKRVVYVSDPIGQYYEFFHNLDLEVRVRGTCVWMAPGGIRFDNRVTFKRAPGAGAPPTLIIVTAPNGRHTEPGDDYRDVGLWFLDQGVRLEDDVRVILVSSGHVRMEIASVGSSGGGGGYFDFRFDHLNVFADHITLMGPRHQDGEMRLTYDGVMDALVDDLVARGVLPAVTGQAAGGFTPIAGSWRSP